MAVAKINTKRLKMALTSHVDENWALRTCIQMFCKPADKIDRFILIHLRVRVYFFNILMSKTVFGRLLNLSTIYVSDNPQVFLATPRW